MAAGAEAGAEAEPSSRDDGGDARVRDDGRVRDEARVRDDARIRDDGRVRVSERDRDEERPLPCRRGSHTREPRLPLS